MNILFIILFFLLLSTQHVYAHVLSREGNVGGVIHIEPDDSPIIGKSSPIYIYVKDITNKFLVENCICTISVKKNDQLLATIPATGSNQSVISDYTFLEKGIYTLTLKALSINNSFEDFSLQYTVRVEREDAFGSKTRAQDDSFQLQSIHFIMISSGFLFFILLIIVNKNRELKIK